MKSVLILTVCLAGTVLASLSTREQFDSFAQKYNKVYATPGERLFRLAVFIKNLREIEKHNAAGRSFHREVNEFTDLTEKEFKDMYLGYVNTGKPAGPVSKATFSVKDLPESVDWRDKNVITAPKNQGACGSCWAFATVEQIESYVAINNNADVADMEELSAQHITSCTPNELQCGGSGGCMGSIPQLGFVYTQLFGLQKESDYPYTATTGRCEFDPSNGDSAHVTLRGYETIERNNQDAIMNHLANVGPLSVAVDASRWGSYGGGIFDDCNFFNNIEINHAVQMVGYGSDGPNKDYWIVRNSWGAGWGEGGYIKLKREDKPQCGTDSTPLYGTGCVNDGVTEQHVCGQCGVLYDTCYPIGADLVPAM